MTQLPPRPWNLSLLACRWPEFLEGPPRDKDGRIYRNAIADFCNAHIPGRFCARTQILVLQKLYTYLETGVEFLEGHRAAYMYNYIIAVLRTRDTERTIYSNTCDSIKSNHVPIKVLFDRAVSNTLIGFSNSSLTAQPPFHEHYETILPLLVAPRPSSRRHLASSW